MYFHTHTPYRQHRQMHLHSPVRRHRRCMWDGTHANTRSIPVRSPADDSHSSTSRGRPFSTRHNATLSLPPTATHTELPPIDDNLAFLFTVSYRQQFLLSFTRSLLFRSSFHRVSTEFHKPNSRTFQRLSTTTFTMFKTIKVTQNCETLTTIVSVAFLWVRCTKQ